MVKIDITMPTYCYDCPCHDGENGKCNITGAYVFDKRPFDCPLQEDKSATDVEEVKCSKFVSELVKKLDWRGIMQDYYQPNSCANCHTALTGTENYCPNCGAKMDENGDENAKEVH